jgi:hypothetical protein
MKQDVDYIKDAIDEQKIATKANRDDIESLKTSRAWLQGAWAVLSVVIIWIGSHIPKGLL